MNSTEDLFHLGIKAIIRNDEGKVLLLKANPGAYWDLPGGRVRRGDSVEDTLRRELKEETSLTGVKSIKPFAMALSDIRIPLQPDDAGLIFSTYLCEVEGAETIKLSAEHTAYDWYLPSDAASLLGEKYATDFLDKLRTLQHASGQRTASIGCEAYIVREGKLLLGLRKNVFGAGTWALPGGHLEFLDHANHTIARELKEETGLVVAPAAAKLLAVTDAPEPVRQTHYIHLTFGVDIGDQEPKVTEPEFCEEWKWFPLDKLPGNLFPPHVAIFKAVAAGQHYS